MDSDVLNTIHDGSKLTMDRWKLIDAEGTSFFSDFPFFDDPKFHDLTPLQQRYLLAYSLRDIFGYREYDAYRFASNNYESNRVNCNSSVCGLKKRAPVKYFLDKIDWARVETMGFSAKKLIEAETELSYSDLTEYLDEEGSFVGNLKDLPIGVRRAIKSFEVSETTDKDGDVTRKYKIRLWDKGQSLHRMEKIKGMHLDRSTTSNTTTAITGEMSAQDAAKAYTDMMKGNKE